jgi:hypothetical protein
VTLAATLCAAGIAGVTTASAGVQTTDGACNLLAGSPDSCKILGQSSGTASFVGAIGTDSQFKVSHQVVKYILAGGCYKGSYSTVVDVSASAAGPVNVVNQSLLPGITYLLTLTGTGEVFGGYPGQSAGGDSPPDVAYVDGPTPAPSQICGSSGTSGSGTSGSGTGGAGGAGGTSPGRPGPEWLFRAVHEEPASLTDPTTGLTSHTIYRPEDLSQVPFKMPIMIWGNGGCRVSSREFSYFLNQMASYGFFIVARGNADLPLVAGDVAGLTDPRPDELIRGLNWALAQNQDPKSPYYQRLDPTRAVASGQSCGAGEAAVASEDARVRTAILFNQGCFTGLKLNNTDAECFARKRPATLYVTGGPDDVGYPPAKQDFELAKDNVPLAWADNPAVSHTGMWDDDTTAAGGVASTGRVPALYQNEPLIMAWKWLDYIFYGDTTSRAFFFGTGCGLCQRGGWTLKTKN